MLTDDGATVDCKVKGNFRLKGIRSTNPVAVGDRVVVNDNLNPNVNDSGGYWITGILDRKNYIIRKASNLSKQSSIIAANVDQAMLIVTIRQPETSTTFIDRFLASAEAYRVPVILVFNKVDILDDDERRYLSMVQQLYENIGYQCLVVSATEGTGLSELQSSLQGKITLLSGNSGVGKSTLINAIIPGANLRTADICDAHGQGMHTTTFSEMIPLPPLSNEVGRVSAPRETRRLEGSWSGVSLGGYLIDTPGIRGFGTFDIEPHELTSYFREIFQFSKDCRFSDCTHTHEPGCAVLQAVEDHYIALSRYQSYLSMLEDKDEGKYRKPE